MKILLVVLIAAGIGCSHAANQKETRVFVTGSHIARTADPARVPQTISPLSIHSREQLAQTGRQFDLHDALRELDPSVR